MTKFAPSHRQNGLCWPFLFAALLVPRLLSATPPDERLAVKFEVALARSCFSNVNVNDALASYRVFLESVGLPRAYRLKPEVTICDDTPSLAAAISQGTFHFAVMDAWQFLGLEQRSAIKPYFVPTINGEVGRKYVVIVRRGSGIHTVADLRGRAVVLLETVDNNVCRAWLESFLPTDSAHPATNFFSAMARVTKPTAGVLPVFFGQKDACIADESGFNLMKELNPQIGKVLEVIAASDLIADYLICLGEQEWELPGSKEDTVRGMSNLANDPAGRQMLALFKISGVVAFDEEYLAPARILFGAQAQRSAASLPPTEDHR